MTDVVNPPVDPLPAAPAVADPAPAADPAPVAAAEPAAAPVVPPAAAPAPVAPAEAAAPPAVTAPPVVAPPATTMPAIPASMPAMAPATMGLPAAGTVPSAPIDPAQFQQWMQQGTALQQPVAPAVGQPRLHSQMDAAQMQQMQMQQMQQMMQQQQAANMAGMQVPGMQFQMPAVGYGGLAPGQYGLQAPVQPPEPPKPEIVLPDLPICPWEVKKLRVPEIKAMLSNRGIHMEMMQGVLKKDLLEMLLEKLNDEGALKEDPPEKKPRVYIEDNISDDEPDAGAEEEESDEEHYDPESDVSGAEQSEDDTIWADDV